MMGVAAEAEQYPSRDDGRRVLSDSPGVQILPAPPKSTGAYPSPDQGACARSTKSPVQVRLPPPHTTHGVVPKPGSWEQRSKLPAGGSNPPYSILSILHIFLPERRSFTKRPICRNLGKNAWVSSIYRWWDSPNRLINSLSSNIAARK